LNTCENRNAKRRRKETGEQNEGGKKLEKKRMGRGTEETNK